MNDNNPAKPRATIMRPASYVALAIACIAPLFWSSTSHAQAADVARKLLEEAKRLKGAGKLPEACPLLDRAYEMDAKDGLLFARADCRDQERKIAAAVSLYEAYLRSYSRMTGPTKNSHSGRATIAEARLNELRPLVPMIKFVWAEPPPPETKIIVDNIEFRASTLDVRLPLDPGTHEIVVLLPGEPERRRTITLAEGGSTIVDLTPLPPKSAESPKSKQGKSKSQNGKTPKPVAPSKVDPWKVGGFIGIGLGAAGIIAGSITGSMAIAEKRVVDANCTPEHRCNPTGLAAADRFQTVGNASTAAFIAGGVFAAVGTTLVVMAYRPAASSRANAQLRMTVSPSYLGFEGAF